MFKQYGRARTVSSGNTKHCRACVNTHHRTGAALNPDSNTPNPFRRCHLFLSGFPFNCILNFFNGNYPYAILSVLDLFCICLTASFCDRSLWKDKTKDQYLNSTDALRKSTQEQQLRTLENCKSSLLRFIRVLFNELLVSLKMLRTHKYIQIRVYVYV